ncbi:MAG TPA: hypothetical protein VF693_10525 [Allosphingosinicella sp.]|jgi:hypothetical protein
MSRYVRLALISLAAAGVATFCAAVLAGWIVMALSLSDDGGVVHAVLGAFLLLPVIAMFSIGATLGVAPAVTPAAALIGAGLWRLGSSHAYARMRSVWAAAGALFALGVFMTMRAGILPDETGLLNDPDGGRLALSFVLAGAGAALVFRAGFKFLALFFLPDEAEQDP